MAKGKSAAKAPHNGDQGEVKAAYTLATADVDKWLADMIQRWVCPSHSLDCLPGPNQLVPWAVCIILKGKQAPQDIVKRLDDAIRGREQVAEHRWGVDQKEDIGHIYYYGQLKAVKAIFNTVRQHQWIASWRRMMDNLPGSSDKIGEQIRKWLTENASSYKERSGRKDQLRIEELVSWATRLVLNGLRIDMETLEASKEAVESARRARIRYLEYQFQAVLDVLTSAYHFQKSIQGIQEQQVTSARLQPRSGSSLYAEVARRADTSKPKSS